MRRSLVLASLCAALVATLFAAQAGATPTNLAAAQGLCEAQGGQFFPAGGVTYGCVNTSGVAFTDTQLTAATRVCNYVFGGTLRIAVPATTYGCSPQGG